MHEPGVPGDQAPEPEAGPGPVPDGIQRLPLWALLQQWGAHFLRVPAASVCALVGHQGLACEQMQSEGKARAPSLSF